MDFYYKYKSENRVLCSTFRHKKTILNLYRVGTLPTYVLVLNRNVIYQTTYLKKAEDRFFDSIYFESGVMNPELIV